MARSSRRVWNTSIEVEARANLFEHIEVFCDCRGAAGWQELLGNEIQNFAIRQNRRCQAIGHNKLTTQNKEDDMEVLRTNFRKWLTGNAGVIALSVTACLWGLVPVAAAEDEDAKVLFKAMSDYLVGQKAIHFTYDASLEVVTEDLQKLTFASSGSATMARPDKLRFARSGGFVDAEITYDGKTVTALGKNLNVFAKEPIEGTVDEMMDILRFDYNLKAPAADLLSSNPYEIMMSNVTDARDLGNGIIGGKRCDHLAFRTRDTDWEIWIAPGDAPYPCRFTITSKMMALAPSYTIEVTSWKAGADVPADDFNLNTDGAKEVNLENMTEGLEMARDVAEEGVQ